MTTRQAACSCGQLRLTAQGEPLRISVCHCLACQRRTGSPFGMQARFPAGDVRITGESCVYTRAGDSGASITFHFCPRCGATVYYRLDARPEHVAVPVGVFADPTFPAPRVSVYGAHRHHWTVLPRDIEHEE